VNLEAPARGAFAMRGSDIAARNQARPVNFEARRTAGSARLIARTEGVSRSNQFPCLRRALTREKQKKPTRENTI
jgi:hypothetical protein